jgi:hypothetical protein
VALTLRPVFSRGPSQAVAILAAVNSLEDLLNRPGDQLSLEMVQP